VGADTAGVGLGRRLGGMPEWAEIPVIFLTAETAIENKIKGLELGVDDYLTKPIYIKEIVTRINILLQKKQRQFLDLKKDGTRFAGRVADMPVVDVIQTIEVSRKSGLIQFTGGANRAATIYFRDGKVIDAEAGTLQGEDAVYRLLTWSDGEFEVEFRTVRRREVIAASSQGLLMEGMRRLDEWSRLLEQLPPLSHRFEIDAGELSGRLGEVPDDNNRILRLFDGKRTLLEVIDASDFGDLECLQAVSRLYFEGLLIDLDPAVRSISDPGKPGPLTMVDDAPSDKTAAPGPVDLRKLAASAAVASGPAPAPVSSDLALGPTAEMPAAAPKPTAEIQAPKSSLTMGWDAQPDPTEGERVGALGDASTAEAPAPPKVVPKSSLTMGWDAQPDPTETPVPVETSAPAETPSRPVLSPAQMAAGAARSRRDSSVQIGEQDVVGEEEVHTPLSGAYRPSSLRLIDEAVAAAQLIEPSLFEPEELERLGIKPKAPDEASAKAEAADAVARVKAELTQSDPSIEVPPVTAPSTPTAPPNGARGTKKTVPPPIPRTPAKVSPREVDEAPMLDSNLLLSGEHKIPDTADLDDSTPLLDADLLASGEFKMPAAAELAALTTTPPPVVSKSMPIVHVPLPDKGDTTLPEPDDYSAVPTVIEAEEADEDESIVGGPTNLEIPSPRGSQRVKTIEASSLINMKGSHGQDRAEASGELRLLAVEGRASTEPGIPQRDLVTIMPRRKAGDVAPEPASKAADAASDAVLQEQSMIGTVVMNPADLEEEPAAEAKPAVKPKPAVEPPATPARRTTVEGGVVAPARGPGRLAQVLIAVASLLAGATVFSLCRKEKPAQKPIAEIKEDAALVVVEEPDATEYSGFGFDAGMGAVTLKDAATMVQIPIDAAAVVQVRPDAAAVVQVRPDAATVVQVRPDAGSVAVSTADAGIDKGKEARALFDKAHLALEEGDAEEALALLDQSIKLKKQSKTLLERARALQRLRRIDEAVASIDDAIKMNESYAPAWEQKGMLLWSEKKYAEARPALEMYLQLAPDGARADTIRSMLDEPR